MPYGEIAHLNTSFAALRAQASAIGNEIFYTGYTGRERDPVTGPAAQPQPVVSHTVGQVDKQGSDRV